MLTAIRWKAKTKTDVCLRGPHSLYLSRVRIIAICYAKVELSIINVTIVVIVIRRSHDW